MKKRFSFSLLHQAELFKVVKNSIFHYAMFLTAVLVSGCASFKPSYFVEPSSFTGTQNFTEIKSHHEAPGENQPEPVRSFESDTLYDLLVAELGGQRKQHDLALGNYLKQAHKTQDIGITRRAYQISQLMGVRQAALDAALLWSKLDAENPSAYRAAAIELVRSGYPDESFRRMSAVLRLQGDAAFDVLAANAAELTPEKRVKLLQAFDRALESSPGLKSLLLGKAVLLLQNKHHDKAMALCDQLILTNPDDLKVLILKGRILNQTGRSGEAEKLLSDTLVKHPDSFRLRLSYARVLIHRSQFDEAREQFQRLLHQSPHNAEVLLSLGLIALENKQPRGASDYLMALLQLGQKTNTAHFYLGRIAEQENKPDEALDHYLSVLPGKEFMMSRVSVVRLLLQEHQVADARQQLEQDRYRYPVHGIQLFLLEGEVLFRGEQYEEAVQLLSDALVRYPGRSDLLYSRAMVSEKLGQLEDLEKDLRMIIDMEPDNAIALNALGFTLADRTDRFDEARGLIEQAYKIDGEDPAILDSMGWIQFRLGNYQVAHDYLAKAYEKHPDSEVAAHLGEVLWKMGRHQEALLLFDKALKKRPKSQILLETRERLKQSVSSVNDNVSGSVRHSSGGSSAGSK